jgi:hypothetical protein
MGSSEAEVSRDSTLKDWNRAHYWQTKREEEDSGLRHGLGKHRESRLHVTRDPTAAIGIGWRTLVLQLK